MWVWHVFLEKFSAKKAELLPITLPRITIYCKMTSLNLLIYQNNKWDKSMPISVFNCCHIQKQLSLILLLFSVCYTCYKSVQILGCVQKFWENIRGWLCVVLGKPGYLSQNTVYNTTMLYTVGLKSGEGW